MLFTKKDRKNTKSALKKIEKKRGKRIRKELLPSTANTICYQALFENGLMQVKPNFYSQSFALGEANYQTASIEDKGFIMERYSDLINSLDEKSNFQLTITNKPIDLEKFRQSVLYEHREDGFDRFRDEFNAIMRTTLETGENNFRTEKVITIGKQEPTRKLGYRSTEQVGEYFRSGFSEMNISFDTMTGEKRVNLLADILRGENRLSFSYRDLEISGTETRDFIAPMVISFKNKNYIEIDDRILKIVYVRDYSMELGDRFVRDLIQSDKELMISFHASPYSKAEAMKKLRTKKNLMESQKVGEQQKNAHRGYFSDSVGDGLESNLSEADELLQTMAKTGEKLFDTVFLIGIFADSHEDLKESLDVVRQVAATNDLIIDNLPYMQEQALNSLLPLGYNFLQGIGRGLLTSNIAVNSPWTSVDLQEAGGKFYGINQLSSNIVMINRSHLKTSSGLILGTPGSGKGMAAKHEIISTKLQEDEATTEIIIVDPENEYSIIADYFNGERIDIAPDSSTHINILDLPTDKIDEDPIKVKSEFLLTWFSKLLGRRIEGREKSIIDRVTRLTYRDHAKPSLKEWASVLGEQPEEEAQDLALDMELYVEGSLDIFSQKTNIQTESNFIVYNVQKLGEELKQIALMVIFDQIWNRVARNKRLGITTWIYFDEMQLLLLDKYASDFFFTLWSRVRKYGATPTGITQNVETLLLDANGRRIIANSEFMILLQQAKYDREELVRMLGLSSKLENYLISPEKGAGLIKAGNTVVPFKNKIPKHTKLYQIMSTDPKEVHQ